MHRVCILLIALATLVLLPRQSQAVEYRITYLDGMEYASGINNAGQIVGGTLDGHAAIWENGSVIDLGSLGGARMNATSISPAGYVAGFTDTDEVFNHSFLAGKNLPIVDIGTLDGTWSGAAGVNDSKWVVGIAHTYNQQNHAFLWRDGKMIDLGTQGGTYSRAAGINSRGQVVCEYNAPLGRIGSFLWEDGVVTHLGEFRPVAINERGQVLGQGGSIWENGSLTHLSGLGEAVGFNNMGQVIGSAYGRFQNNFLWENGEITDVNDLLPPGTDQFVYGLTGINDHGQIVGMGWVHGSPGAIRLDPVPEPSSLAALALGLGCTCGALRRGQWRRK